MRSGWALSRTSTLVVVVLVLTVRGTMGCTNALGTSVFTTTTRQLPASRRPADAQSAAGSRSFAGCVPVW